MAILNRFLHLLKLLEDLAEFGDFLVTPTGMPFLLCMVSYQALMAIGCDISAAAILAIAAALTLYCTTNRPTY